MYAIPFLEAAHEKWHSFMLLLHVYSYSIIANLNTDLVTYVTLVIVHRVKVMKQKENGIQRYK